MSTSTTSRPQPGKSTKGDSEKSKPLFVRRVWTGTGAVEVTVFDRMIDTDSGEIRVFNILANRTWKDDEGYQAGNNFPPEDLLPLAIFLEEAWTFIQQESSKR